VTVRSALAAALATIALLSGCAGGDEPDSSAPAAPVVLRAATLLPGQPLPDTTGTPLLTVTGVDAADGTGTVAFDRGRLDRLSQVELRTYEPWVKQTLTFRGVWLADVLTVAGAEGAASVRVTALDDYAVTLTRADLSGGGVLLATGDATGAALPLEDGGPTRIVFRSGSASGANADQWIWSLRTVDAR
jgi:hypothetical protein